MVALSSLLCLCLVLTLVPKTVQAADPPHTFTFISETAEESTFEEWNVQWERFDDNAASGEDYWCRTMHQTHGSDRSIYCARNGFNSHYLAALVMPDGGTAQTQPWNVNITALPGTTPQTEWTMRYDTDQDSIMRKAIVGGSAYGTITMTFWFYSSTGSSDARQPDTNESVGYDFLNAIYYTGGGAHLVKHVLWTDTSAQAKARTWTQVSVSVPNRATMVGFEFVSGHNAPSGGDAEGAFGLDGTKVVNGGMQEGVYLDDISVVGSDPSPTIPVITSVDALAPLVGNRSFPVGFMVNSPTNPIAYTNLFYRQGETGAWSRYTTGSGPEGGFSTSPIIFTAAADGKYEFFTQGVDVSGSEEPRHDEADASTVIDSLPPSTTIALDRAPPATGAYAAAVSFTLSADDPGSGVDSTSYRVDDGAWTRFNGSSVLLPDDGNHQVWVYSVDRAGNAEVALNETVKVDLQGPMVTFPEPGRTYASRDITIRFDARDTVTGVQAVQISLDGAPFQPIDAWSGSISLVNLSDGVHHLIVKAQDLSGNWAQTSDTFYVDPRPAGPDWAWIMGLGAALFLGGLGFIYLRSGKRR